MNAFQQFLRGFFVVLSVGLLAAAAGVQAATEQPAAVRQRDAGPARPKTVVLVTGENEYSTGRTLPEFAGAELAGRGYRVVHVAAPETEGSPDFKDYEAIRSADVIVVSVRRRTPPKAMMELLRSHLQAGKPLVGIRTASHAWDARPSNDTQAAWTDFDTEILGADYQNHYGNKPPAGPYTVVDVVAEHRGHPVLRGVAAGPKRVMSHLYRNRNLGPGVTVLMRGKVEGREEQEPVAWVNTGGNRRVFYTSMGSVEDFREPFFRRLLLNGIVWALGDSVPTADSGSGL